MMRWIIKKEMKGRKEDRKQAREGGDAGAEGEAEQSLKLQHNNIKTQ